MEIKPEVHICGKCFNKFETEEEYLNHKCQATGFKPIEPENLGDEFKKIQEASLKRGEERQEAVETNEAPAQ